MSTDGPVSLEERIAASFATQSMLARLGARLERVEHGHVVIALPASDGLLQQHGFVHGGAVMTIADSAAGYAALTMAPGCAEVLTIECKTNFLRPARGALQAEGRVIKAGRSVTVAEADVFDAKRALVAKMLATMAVR